MPRLVQVTGSIRSLRCRSALKYVAIIVRNEGLRTTECGVKCPVIDLRLLNKGLNSASGWMELGEEGILAGKTFTLWWDA